MSSNKQKYKDRFGNEWSVRVDAERGKPRRVSFTCKQFRLVAQEDEADDYSDLSLTRLKECFCDAERVLEHEGENWHVGFRKRTGRGGHTQAGMLTRFRSESGEVRYVKGMLHFRHMSQAALRRHLVAAAPATGSRARASSGT